MSDVRFNRWLHQSGTGGIYQDSSGNIGIGTSVPTSALDVQSGTIKIGSNTLSSSGVSTFTSLSVTGQSNLTNVNVSGVSTFSQLNVGTGGTVITTTAGGLVGIGTVSPDTNLHIQRSSAPNDTHGILKIESTNSTSGNATNSSLINKNKYGWSQFMQWENYGVRVGCRSTTGGGAGEVYFTYGSDNVGLIINASGNLKVNTANAKILNSSGNPILQQTGSILQVVTARNGDYYSTTSTSFTDITGLSLNITPTSSTSKIFLQLSLGRATTNLNNLDYICVLRILANGSDAININGNSSGSRIRGCMNVQGLAFNADHSPGGWTCSALESPGTTSTITYKAQVVCQGSSYAFIMNGSPNNSDTGSTYHYRAQSSLTAWEIAG